MTTEIITYGPLPTLQQRVAKQMKHIIGYGFLCGVIVALLIKLGY